jgi:hypothetical protein
MNTKITMGALLTSAVILSASAQTVSQTLLIGAAGFDPSVDPWANGIILQPSAPAPSASVGSVMFTPWNDTVPGSDPGNFLIDVSYSVTVWASVSYTLQEPSSGFVEATSGLGRSGTVQISGPGGGPPGLSPDISGLENIVAGSGTLEFGPFSAGPFNDSANLASYLNGPVSFSGLGDFRTSLTVESENISGTTAGFWGAQIDLVYTYVDFDPIPEASTYAAGGLLGLAGLGTYIRRRRSSQATD